MKLSHIYIHLFLSLKIAKFGRGIFSQIKVFFIAYSIPLRKRLYKKNPYKKHILPLSFEGKKFDFTITNTADLAVLKEVFFSQEYKVVLQDDPKVVVDLGSNIGASVVYFALKYSKAKIYAFEPDPKNYDLLMENIAAFPNIIPYHGAVSADGKPLRLYVYPTTSLSSSVHQRTENQESIEVPSQTLDEFFEKQKIEHVDLLKFDIEGAELQVFQASKERDRIGHFIGEIHEDLMGGTKEDFIALFPNHRMDSTFCYQGRYILEGIKNV